MHYRVRPSVKDLSKQEISIVDTRNEEQPADPKIQKLWEDEQAAQHSGQEPLYYMKRSKSTFLTDFVVEFVELGCQYVFVISNGVGQWFYDDLDDPSRSVIRGYPIPGPQEVALPIWIKSVAHPFFCEVLVQVTVQMHKSLMTLLLAGGQLSDWVFCHQPKSHYHQIVKVYWNLELYSEDLKKAWEDCDRPEIGYTTHIICGNARLVDIFNVLCGENAKAKDELFLTDVPTYYDLVRYNYMRAKGSDRPMLKMVIGKSYSYRQANIEQLWLCDLGWKFHIVDGSVWVIPSRRSWLEQTTKKYSPVRPDSGEKHNQKEFMFEGDTKIFD